MQLQVESFTIHNGQVPCQFEFINKPDEESYCKPWLSVSPSRGFLLPGEGGLCFRAPGYWFGGHYPVSARFPGISSLFLSILLSA